MPSPDDMRVAAAAVARATGNEDISDALLESRLGARGAAPLLAGMIEGTIRQMFAPMLGVRDVQQFDPIAIPLTTVVTMADGTRLVVTIEAVQ